MDTISSTLLQAYFRDRVLLSNFVASSIVMFLYDWMLMLPAEIEFVWTASLRRPLNVLYIIQRYMPFVDTVAILFVVSFVQPIDSEACRILYNISGWMYITGIALTDVLLTARTWALWGKDIRLTIGLPVFFLCCWVPNFYIIHRFLRSQTFLPSPLPQEIGCVILGGQPVLYLCWVLLTIYEAVILILMLIPGFRDFRTGGWLTRVVYRDGIAYYIIIFIWSVVNVVAILLLPVNNFNTLLLLCRSKHLRLTQHVFENLFSSYQRVMHTVLTSRAVLHMRSKSRKIPTTRSLAIVVTREHEISGLDDEDTLRTRTANDMELSLLH
ncbi:hypothetical protein C8J55DRAFT_553103 [Lentinula edodes]|uniref:DUF6533 domain-containing protein n=1 Tax=Lentinula lateritia TaxID=40482 RepID=A0A9W9DDL7_9AGAR|nr:hypothetical protein C8J55DRAFT_553103 [Lentinula edodes]